VTALAAWCELPSSARPETPTSTHTRSCSVLQRLSSQRWPLQLQKHLLSGAATSKAMDRDRNAAISSGCMPIGRRTANAPTSISEQRYAATRRTYASTSVELYRRWANCDRSRAGLGTRVSNAPGAHGSTHPCERPKPARIATFFVVELACILCSRDVGVFRSETWPAPASVLISHAGVAPSVAADWRQLRCQNCGGNVLPSEIEQRTVRIESRIDWESDKPRRGRPPKWLAEERSRAGNR
jgi:hypothetical protein